MISKLGLVRDDVMYQHLRPYQSSKIVIKGTITIGRKRNREIVRDERFLKKEIKKNKIKKRANYENGYNLVVLSNSMTKEMHNIPNAEPFRDTKSNLRMIPFYFIFAIFLKDSFTYSKILLRKLLSIIRNVRKFHSCPTNNDNH